MCASIIGSTACEKSDAFLKINKNKLDWTFDCEGGAFSIPVNSNYAYTVELDSGVDWITYEVIWQQVKVTVAPQAGGTDRDAEIVIRSKDCEPVAVAVHQKIITLRDTPEKIELTNDKLTFSLEVAAGVEIGFETPDWISPVDDSWQCGAKVYTFAADRFLDTEAESRTGEIVVRPADSGISFRQAVTVEQSNYTNAAIKKLCELWATQPLQKNLTAADERYRLLAAMEEYSKLCDRTTFRDTYLAAPAAKAQQMEQEYEILSCYRYSFDHVLEEVKHTTVRQGTAVVWMLYNMGMIVKTPSQCFGIDLNHYYAAEFAPYIDFLCVTHNHTDHTDAALNTAMLNAGKPVLSNFFTQSSAWCSKSAAVYHIGDATIRTTITDHDKSTPLFTTAYRIDCGADAGGFSIMHCGDSSYDTAQYAALEGGEVSLLVLRFGQAVEQNIIGTGAGQVMPHCVFFSHLIEMRHNIDQSPMRATILGCLGNMAANIDRTDEKYLPFWGERFVWENGQLKSGM